MPVHPVSPRKFGLAGLAALLLLAFVGAGSPALASHYDYSSLQCFARDTASLAVDCVVYANDQYGAGERAEVYGDTGVVVQATPAPVVFLSSQCAATDVRVTGDRLSYDEEFGCTGNVEILHRVLRDTSTTQICEYIYNPSTFPLGYVCSAVALDVDADEDGYYRYADRDCDDADPLINPGATDSSVDGVDQNCSGVDGGRTYFLDGDGDGYGGPNTFTSDDPAPPNGFTISDDCDDAAASVYPGAQDVPNDGIDQNCNGSDAVTYHADNDQDTFGDPSNPADFDGEADFGYVTDDTDCNDADSNVNPGATDVAGDGIDQDCSGADGAPKATPTMSTQASATSTVGQDISDTATISGLGDSSVVFSRLGSPSGGTVSFEVFGPDDEDCSGPSRRSQDIPVSGDGAYNSGPFSTTQAGTYRFVARYSGNADNEAADGACNDEGETTEVALASPTIVTQATSSAVVGQPISDRATVTGLYTAEAATQTGTIAFDLYGPQSASADPDCSGRPVFSTEPVAVTPGTSVYDSGAHTATSSGSYYWVATYSGDANNEAVIGGCGEDSETTVVTQPVFSGGESHATPSASASESAEPSASSSATAEPSRSATPTTTTSASSSSAAPQRCRVVTLIIHTRTINATGLASVTVSGASPGSAIELQGYSQNHFGTASFDNDPTPVDRTGMSDSNGAVSFNDLRPASNTRLQARQAGCVFSDSAVIQVRATETLKVTRTGPYTYTFSGVSIPARPGGLIVSLYRIVGKACAAGVRPSDCPGEVFLAQDRAEPGESDGELNGAGAGGYAIRVRFSQPGSSRGNFVVKTGQDAQNIPGRSNTRSLLIY